MTYFSRSIAAPLTAALIGFSFATAPFSVLAHNEGGDDVDRVVSVIPATLTPSVFIGPDGSVLVRGAKVTAVSTSTISATTAWGSANLSWTLNTTAATTFSNASDPTSASRVVAVGDIVSFKGSLVQTSPAFVVNVKIIRNWSHVIPNPLKITGSVSSVSTSTSTFILKKDDRSITVALAAGASITQNGTTTSFSSIVAGSKVTVLGSYNTSTTILTATSIVIMSSPQPQKKNKDKKEHESFSWGQLFKELRANIAARVKL